jgi:hypothetical protein
MVKVVERLLFYHLVCFFLKLNQSCRMSIPRAMGKEQYRHEHTTTEAKAALSRNMKVNLAKRFNGICFL